MLDAGMSGYNGQKIEEIANKADTEEGARWITDRLIFGKLDVESKKVVEDLIKLANYKYPKAEYEK